MASDETLLGEFTDVSGEDFEVLAKGRLVMLRGDQCSTVLLGPEARDKLRELLDRAAMPGLTVAAVTPELAGAMGEIADAAQQEHEHSFPVQPPHGSLLAPGPCACGKTWALSQAEKLLAAALAALTVARREAGDG